MRKLVKNNNMLNENYINAMKLLESGEFKQKDIARNLNISIDIVKKLSQLNKIYKITNNDRLLNIIKDLNFNALELRYLKYEGSLEDVLLSLNKNSSRLEVRQACIKANELKNDELQQLRIDQAKLEREKEYNTSLKNAAERDLKRIIYRIEELEDKYYYLEKILSRIDYDLASFIYNRYIELKLMESDSKSWFLEFSIRRGVKIDNEDWNYLTSNGIVERAWRSSWNGYNYAINKILSVEKFIDYMSKYKTKRSKITDLELLKDKARDLKKRDLEKKEKELDIARNSKRIEELNNEIKELDVKRDMIIGKMLVTYSNYADSGYSKGGMRIVREGCLYLDNVIVDDINLDRIVLEKSGHVTIYIKDKFKVDDNTNIGKVIFDRYSGARFQKLRELASKVIIVSTIISEFGFNCNRSIDLNKLEDIYFEEKNNYRDVVEAIREEELLYILGLELSKRFLY